MQPIGCFCPFQFHFACVIGSCIHFGTGVYFCWNFTISPPFPLINLFCTRCKTIVPLRTFWTKMSPLKLLFLIAVPFNCKSKQFLLIGFNSVGKALKCCFVILQFFTRWCHFSGLVYKANTRFIPVFCYCIL